MLGRPDVPSGHGAHPAVLALALPVQPYRDTRFRY